jgi:tRNA 2-thiouridine synthesizing protein E
MSAVTFEGKTYLVDNDGFLLNFGQWDEDFAMGTASALGNTNGLTDAHWRVIYFIRRAYEELGKCPLVYQTCKMNGLRLKELRELFPTGYLRGACKIAGVTYREGYLGNACRPAETREIDSTTAEKTYRIDVRGFLVDPLEWDEQFAIHKACEMKVPEKLGSRHWQVIYYLREKYRLSKVVPTVYQTCEANDLDLEELERLFPDGYHRGAVKIAGLRAR